MCITECYTLCCFTLTWQLDLFGGWRLEMVALSNSDLSHVCQIFWVLRFLLVQISWQCHDSTCVTEYLSVTLSAGGTASHRNVTTQLFPVPPTNDGALVPDVNNIVEVEGLLFEKCHWLFFCWWYTESWCLYFFLFPTSSAMMVLLSQMLKI